MIRKLQHHFEHLAIAGHLLKWSLLALPVAAAAGSAVALFLWLLDRATDARWQHGWLLWLLPLCGIVIHLLYKHLGKNSEAGNNLIFEEIHEPGGGVPLRMTPLVLGTTILTHLFGGSAGREGTAVQMGGSLAHFFARLFRLERQDVRVMLMMGVAAGFGAVFGTVIAGAIFALEVQAVGRIHYKALLPCFLASLLGHLVCSAWGIAHTTYTISSMLAGAAQSNGFHFNGILMLQVVAAGIAFGLAGFLFAELTHSIRHWGQRLVKPAWMLPALGGILIISGTLLLGTRDYLGLGVTNPLPGGISILSAFQPGGADPFSWWWKILFTAITLGTGFKGGEVTPLFFIGATLGNTIASLSGAPTDLMAGLGFIAVFAGATNTPIACTLMGVELFGGEFLLYYATACFLAYYFSGHSGIYSSQRLAYAKTDALSHQQNQTLGDTHRQRRQQRQSLLKRWRKS
ncbi:MAG: voltage-gated chloride channel family protein [Chitinophagaceae bacterium]|nr:voltage-gated chloride channel family protein [Chitinophagaceae bacterium]